MVAHNGVFSYVAKDISIPQPTPFIKAVNAGCDVFAKAMGIAASCAVTQEKPAINITPIKLPNKING